MSETRSPWSGTEWLDLHFEACRPMYEAAVSAAGFTAGSHVLDAGCGTGAFISALAHIVGPKGKVTGLDLNEEHVKYVAAMAPKLPCRLETKVGSVFALPFPDATFDGLWLSNIALHFDDNDTLAVLAECKRVLKPRGTLAVKECWPEEFPTAPGDAVGNFWQACMSRLDARNEMSLAVAGTFRAPQFHRLVEKAGFADVTQREFIHDYGAPLTEYEREWVKSFFIGCLPYVEEFGVPDGDLAFWKTMTTEGFARPEHLIHQSDFRVRERNELAIGKKPTA